MPNIRRVAALRRTSLLAFAVLLLAASSAAARSVTVAWDPNPPSENVAGYILHYGTVSRTAPGFAAYASQLDVGNVTRCTVDLPESGAVYYLSVVAYNAAGLRSDYSAELSAVPPGQDTFTIAVTAGMGGSIRPGSRIVTQGESRTFTVTPSPDYGVADVLVDGTSVGAVTTYVFPDISADHTLEAVFVLLQDSDGNGLPDPWEERFFGRIGISPGDDPDGDGMSNWEEYLYGTDPTTPNPNPALTPAVRAPVSGGTVISRTPEMAVYNAMNSGSAKPRYEFVLALDPAMDQIVGSAVGVEEGLGGTGWSAPQVLRDQTRYYWRARALADAATSEWTPVCTFYVDTAGRETRAEVDAAEYVSGNTGVLLEIEDTTARTRGVLVDLEAVMVPYDYVLTVGSVENPPVFEQETRLLGRVVEFGPHGMDYTIPVKILLPYTDQNLAEAGVTSPQDLGVFTYNTVSLRWEEVPVVGIDYLGRRLVSEVDHFSLYAIGTRPADSPGGGGGGGCFLQSLGF